jgi:hypothetical protein
MTTHEQAAVLRSFASLLSTHRHYSGEKGVAITSQECLQQQQEELPRLFAASNDEHGLQTICCSVPCLELGRAESGSSITQLTSFESCSSLSRPSSANERCASSLEEITAESLRRRINLTKEQVPDLPLILLSNVTHTFVKLVQARLRQAAKALMSRGSTFSTRNEAFTSARLLASLSKRPPSAVVTTYKTLDFVDRCSRVQNLNEQQVDEEAVVVVPVILEVVMDWTLFDTADTITTTPMEAPGVLQGQFVIDHRCRSDSLLLHSVDMELDTGALLQSMMQQAKLLVRKALVAAACLAGQSSTISLFRTTTAPSPSWVDLAMMMTVPQEHSSDVLLGIHGYHAPQARNVVIQDTADDSDSDDEEDMEGASAVLGGKTPLEELFETETPSDQLTTSRMFRCMKGDEQSTATAATAALVENPSMPPPSKRFSSRDDINNADPNAIETSSPSGKKSALSLLSAAVDEVQRETATSLSVNSPPQKQR